MAKLLDIVIDPDPELRKTSKELDPNKIKSPKYKELFDDMILTMHKKDGVGLAAPQIGKKLRVVIVNTSNGSVCMINPKIIKKSWRKQWGEEGCLSVPDTFGEVQRHKKITCIYLDWNQKPVKVEAEDMLARIIQHEIDHLDGILFIDKAKNIKKVKTDS